MKIDMYICEICEETFPTKRLKRNHVSLHNRVLWTNCNWNRMDSNKPSRKEIIAYYQAIKSKCDDILFHHILKNKLFYRIFPTILVINASYRINEISGTSFL